MCFVFAGGSHCSVHPASSGNHRRGSEVLPYLGPEIIAVIQAGFRSAPNDSRSDVGLPFGSKSGGEIILSITVSCVMEQSERRMSSLCSLWIDWLS